MHDVRNGAGRYSGWRGASVWSSGLRSAETRKAEPRPFAWLSLDPSDDDPVRFWSYVIAALRRVAPGFGGSLLGALPNAGPRLIERELAGWLPQI